MKENQTFRNLYFFGIILVVAGHCGGGGISLFSEWFTPYTFHLGIFAFASGYFFINNQDKKIKDIIKKKFTSLIIPLYVWHFIYAALALFLKKFGLKFASAITFENMILSPIYSGHAFIFNLGSWFLVPLFMIQVFSSFLLPILKKPKGALVIFLGYLLLGFGGVQLAILGFNTKWWLVLIRMLYFLPFFGLGMLYRQKLENHDKLNSSLYFAIIFMIQLAVIYYNGGTKVYYPSWCKNFDNFYMPYLLGFLGIAFWLRISKVLVPVLKNNKIVKWISRNTFAIMMHHLFGFFMLNSGYAVLANLGIIKHFNFSKFYTYPFYTYLPKNLKQFAILYVIVGIIFAYFIWLIENKGKSFFKKVTTKFCHFLL